MGSDRDLYSGTSVAWKRSLQPVHSSTFTAGRFGSQRFALVAVCQSIESVSPDFHHHQRLGTGTDDIRPASSGCPCLRQWQSVETIGALPDSCHRFRYFSGYQPDRFFTLGSLWISFRVYTCTSIHGSYCSIPVFSLAGHQDNFWPNSSCQHDRVFYLLPVCCLAFRRLDELFSDIKKPAPGSRLFKRIENQSSSSALLSGSWNLSDTPAFSGNSSLISSLSSRSTITEPPATSLPNSSSSASALRIRS